MKLDTKQHNVDASGMMNQRKFTVDAGAHIMQVLSGLYKNPVDAMVREYLTNMFDAYVALKRVRPDAEIRPPVLHVPTSLDGNLTFRDFGIGMSLETVWNVYATYGASTKNGSNDEVGGFGLGSKTAFCYNGGASWSIESRYEGQKHVFMAFIGQDGVPNLSHVTSMPTDEPSGLTISIPIRREDHRTCIEAAHKYVPYFPMAITVEGTTLKPVDYVLKAKTWAVRPTTGRYDYNVSRVVMGNVPYPIDMNAVRATTTDYTIREFLNRNSFDVFVNIGDVDIVPSRDDMKYTDRTKKAIVAAFKRIITEIGAEVGKQLDACDDEWAALTMYRGMNQITYLHEVVRQIMWRGKAVNADGISREAEALLKLDRQAKVTKYAITDSGRATIEVFESPALVVSPNKQTFVIIDDLPKGGAMMARALIHQQLVNRSTASGRTSRYGHTVGHVLLIQTNLTKAQLGSFFGGMPASAIRTTSELKGVVPVPANLKGTKDTIYRWSGTSWDARVNVPTGTTMYYLPLTKDTYTKRFSFVSNRYGSQKEAIQLVRTAAGNLGIKVDTLYGIKSEDVKNFDSSWVNLVTAMEATMNVKIKQEAETFALSLLTANHETVGLYQTVTSAGLQKADAEFSEFIEYYEKAQNASRSTIVHTFRSLTARIAGLEDTMLVVAKGVPTKDMNKMAAKITNQYPMLGVLSAMCQANNYGNGRAELLKNNSTKVLAYVKAMS